MRKTAKNFISFYFILMFSFGAYSQGDDPRQTPVVKVVRDNAPAVVNISTERIVFLRDYPFWGSYGSEFDVFFEDFFSGFRPRRALRLNSVGSGVIVDKKGLIVTNAHVVNMASNIFVILSDGESVEGEVVYQDPDNDLAIVKIDAARELPTVSPAEPEDIIIGETVVAIGNPLGLENSVTMGIISGKKRSLEAAGGVRFDELIQTDAPINPGNSGGPLLNMSGELAGINLAVVQNSQSIGFAVPVKKVMKVLDDYKNGRSAAASGAGKPGRPGPGSVPFPGNGFMRGIFDDDWAADSSDFDMVEEKDRYVIKMDITGLEQSKINIKVDSGYLTVSGERKESKNEKTQKGSFSSHGFGYFSHMFPLPGDAIADKIKTKSHGNTLTIILPKK